MKTNVTAVSKRLIIPIRKFNFQKLTSGFDFIFSTNNGCRIRTAKMIIPFSPNNAIPIIQMIPTMVINKKASEVFL